MCVCRDCVGVIHCVVRMKLPPDADTDTDGSSADVASSNQQDVDFSDYMWMGEEMEEFDSKVLYLFFLNDC